MGVQGSFSRAKGALLQDDRELGGVAGNWAGVASRRGQPGAAVPTVSRDDASRKPKPRGSLGALMY